MMTKFEEMMIMARKRVVWLTVVVVILAIGFLSLSGCGAAWISYSKESQAKQSATKIQQQQDQINDLKAELKQATAKISDQRQQITDLVGEKNNLVVDKNNLVDQLKKKGYKITLKVDGGYEIDEAGVNDSSETSAEEKQGEIQPPKIKDKTSDKPSKKIGK